MHSWRMAIYLLKVTSRWPNAISDSPNTRARYHTPKIAEERRSCRSIGALSSLRIFGTNAWSTRSSPHCSPPGTWQRLTLDAFSLRGVLIDKR
jgi:hypothetical protein